MQLRKLQAHVQVKDTQGYAQALGPERGAVCRRLSQAASASCMRTWDRLTGGRHTRDSPLGGAAQELGGLRWPHMLKWGAQQRF